jgi:hypothetical protein
MEEASYVLLTAKNNIPSGDVPKIRKKVKQHEHNGQHCHYHSLPMPMNSHLKNSSQFYYCSLQEQRTC